MRTPNLKSIRNFFSNLKLLGLFSMGLFDARHLTIQSRFRFLFPIFGCIFLILESYMVPDFCNHCKIHGHAMNKCFIVHPSLKRPLCLLLLMMIPYLVTNECTVLMMLP
ncbi:hypothetical protein IEQ34_008332 [Dendrobium chrysotoxum]|uniref:Uncharacterized protein n=1 Tax=Dendrobium chrysotoxum TaxID=161865 RepID=A0AAV7GYW3_DENCH|nr:hypothetical protein IEQ34_008332 [Dendrobium chrysotoxum]